MHADSGRATMRRAMTLSLALLVPLILAGAFGARADPERQLAGNPVTSVGSGIEAYANRPLAQSFAFSRNVTLSRALLFVADVGIDEDATLSIVRGGDAAPGTTTLASAIANAGPAHAWLEFAFAASVRLERNVTHWIILSSSLVSGDGVTWWNTGYDATDLGRAAVRDVSWSPLSGDFAFVLYGHPDYSFALGFRAPTDVAAPGATIGISVRISLEGEDVVPAWLNVTLPPDLTFADDDLAASGLPYQRSVVPPSVSYALSAVPEGTHAFEFRVSVDPSVANGTPLAVDASLEYAELGGSNARRSAAVTLLALDLATAVEARVLEASAVPGATLHYALNVTNPPGAATLADLRVGLTMVRNGNFTTASGGASVTADAVSWPGEALAGGTSLSYLAESGMAFPLEPGDSCDVAYRVTFDSNGTRLRLIEGALLTEAAVPALAADLAVSSTTATSHDILEYTLTVTNNGTAEAREVWVNDSLDDRLTFLDQTQTGGSFAAAGSSLTWRFDPLAEGPHVIRLRAETAELLQDGARISNLFSVAYRDAAMRPRPTVFSGLALVQTIAPNIEASATVAVTEANTGDIVRETISVRNTGRDFSKLLTISQTLGANLRFVTSTSLAVPALEGGVLSWLYRDVAPGTGITFFVDFQVVNADPQPAVIGLSILVTYSDESGGATTTVLSRADLLRVVPAPSWFSLSNPAILAILAATVAGAALVPARRLREKVVVEDALLVRRDGILVSHRYPEQALTRDPDTFSGMFTAIQDFVRDSFDYREGRTLKELNFGDLSGAVVSGEQTYLAVIYKGRPGPRFRSRLERLVGQIEDQYGGFLEHWDGDRTLTGHIDRMLEPLIQSPSRKRRWRDEAAHEVAHMLSDSDLDIDDR